jgi:hypothetical protein
VSLSQCWRERSLVDRRSERQGDDGEKEEKAQREPEEGQTSIGTRTINRHGASWNKLSYPMHG